MKIVGFEANNSVRLGVVDGDSVVDLQAVDANVPGDLAEVLRRSNGDLSSIGDHVKEGPQRDNIPKFPSIFFRVLTSMVPHGQPIVRSKESIQLDYEAEMVAIIGKRAKHLSMGNAVDCIAGYSCANEGSVREFQRHTTQWGMGKNFDRTGGFGPWMVTADEVPPGGKGLKIASRLN